MFPSVHHYTPLVTGRNICFLFKRENGCKIVLCIVTAIKATYLGELYKDVQSYVRALQKTGAPVGSAVIIAAAKGIVKSSNPPLLAENGGRITLTKSWAHSLILRMGLFKRKSFTKTPTMTAEQLQQRKITFLKNLSLFDCKNIPSSLIINRDQSGIHVVPASNYTMADKGANRVEITGSGGKRQITTTFAAIYNVWRISPNADNLCRKN